jgi:phenylacetate-coenzyme A ligase PaaK-like adenylate-forming protein
MICEFEHKIFSITDAEFNNQALETFHFQYLNNAIYRQFADTLHTDIAAIKLVEQIPFLPISFFKTHTVTSGQFDPAVTFESSGTTGSVNSRHLVKDLGIYEQSFLRAFEQFYGPVNEWCILALLPAYLERKHSSLVVMADALIKKSHHPASNFYLYDHASLYQTLQALEEKQQKTLLIGVTFALLDFAAKYSLPLKHTTIMETGGMKGRREELTRDEVHQVLKDAFQVPAIHSEYGMTELLSQAYSHGEGRFATPPWMKVLLREEDDPLAVSAKARTGVINVVDLANIYSCSFIATDDAGRIHADGSFEVLGRLDHSDVRGCSLMLI